MRNRSQVVRRTAAAVAVLALTATGVGVAGALQSSAGTQPPAATSKSVLLKSITIKADKNIVDLRTKAVLRGKTTGLPKDTVVRVERLVQNKRWVQLSEFTHVNGDGTYSVAVSGGPVGINPFRVVAAKVVSPVTFIAVNK